MTILSPISSKAYTFLKKFLPPGVFRFLGKSKLFKPLREQFLYKNNQPIIVSGHVNFESLSFVFEAPVKVLSKAMEKGIEARITRFPMSQLAPGSTAIDVGANYGFITSAMAEVVKPNGLVFSFEPDPLIFSVLERTVKNNDSGANCILVQKFVGQPGDKGFVTIDQILSTSGIDRVDFIKIDVDGGDFEVLKGAQQLLSRHHPPLVIEMGSNQNKIFSYLSEIGYTHFAGMEGEIVAPPQFPVNLFASTSPILIPPRGWFTRKI